MLAIGSCYDTKYRIPFRTNSSNHNGRRPNQASHYYLKREHHFRCVNPEVKLRKEAKMRNEVLGIVVGGCLGTGPRILEDDYHTLCCLSWKRGELGMALHLYIRG